MRLRFRSEEKEYLDESIISTGDLYRNLIELNTINRFLGGYRASVNGLAKILKANKKIHTILDIGFGGGDLIKQLSEFSKKRKANLFFYGVDLKSDCIRYAEINLAGVRNKELICDDYRNISSVLLKKTDLIHCSLFLHHLTDEEIISLFKFCKSNNCMILANDLHRNRLAYYSIKFLTTLFSRSWLVKNDAPLSVKRGFRKKELESLLEKAGFEKYTVRWTWAFRYVVIATE